MVNCTGKKILRAGVLGSGQGLLTKAYQAKQPRAQVAQGTDVIGDLGLHHGSDDKGLDLAGPCGQVLARDFATCCGVAQRRLYVAEASLGVKVGGAPYFLILGS